MKVKVFTAILISLFFGGSVSTVLSAPTSTTTPSGSIAPSTPASSSSIPTSTTSAVTVTSADISQFLKTYAGLDLSSISNISYTTLEATISSIKSLISSNQKQITNYQTQVDRLYAQGMTKVQAIKLYNKAMAEFTDVQSHGEGNPQYEAAKAQLARAQKILSDVRHSSSSTANLTPEERQDRINTFNSFLQELNQSSATATEVEDAFSTFSSDPDISTFYETYAQIQRNARRLDFNQEITSRSIFVPRLKAVIQYMEANGLNTADTPTLEQIETAYNAGQRNTLINYVNTVKSQLDTTAEGMREAISTSVLAKTSEAIDTAYNSTYSKVFKIVAQRNALDELAPPLETTTPTPPKTGTELTQQQQQLETKINGILSEVQLLREQLSLQPNLDVSSNNPTIKEYVDLTQQAASMQASLKAYLSTGKDPRGMTQRFRDFIKALGSFISGDGWLKRDTLISQYYENNANKVSTRSRILTQSLQELNTSSDSLTEVGGDTQADDAYNQLVSDIKTATANVQAVVNDFSGSAEDSATLSDAIAQMQSTVETLGKYQSLLSQPDVLQNLLASSSALERGEAYIAADAGTNAASAAQALTSDSGAASSESAAIVSDVLSNSASGKSSSDSLLSIDEGIPTLQFSGSSEDLAKALDQIVKDNIDATLIAISELPADDSKTAAAIAKIKSAISSLQSLKSTMTTTTSEAAINTALEGAESTIGEADLSMGTSEGQILDTDIQNTLTAIKNPGSLSTQQLAEHIIEQAPPIESIIEQDEDPSVDK